MKKQQGKEFGCVVKHTSFVPEYCKTPCDYFTWPSSTIKVQLSFSDIV